MSIHPMTKVTGVLDILLINYIFSATVDLVQLHTVIL